MTFKRTLKHLVCTERQVHAMFPPAQLEDIAQLIKFSESQHSGEIRFAVESALDIGPLMNGQTPRERAIEVFSQLQVWDTELNNGVLVYILLADHAIEIVADRGIHAKVPGEYWAGVCIDIQKHFANGEFVQGAKNSIQAVCKVLSEHFPHRGGDKNELPDYPIILG